MLVKFETKSNRVKGVSFHPKRPWVLASLHNGVVQLWDYRMGTLVDSFEEHEGPVRGVSFHSTQPLFVSGGDDYKIKVWNYKQRKCLFTLTGHLDYIRTVFFHHEYPWIISASDDQTIRIWNWQNRQCISVLTGHNHYVMCAQFHPKEDLVVSASLDQTVRVWDISGLRKKNSAPQRGGNDEFHATRGPGGGGGMGVGPGGIGGPNQPDLFGNTDVLVKYVLEGHERGVNWASFHPSLPLIVSGADDRQVKIWRMSDSKAWELDVCKGHYNNVSCVLFHPRQELILSDSEDKSIRVWDMQKRTPLQVFRRETERFWVLACHPELNLFAAGHDAGLIVFKLERERPAYAISDNSLFYVKDKQIRHYDFQNGADVAVIGIKKAPVGLNQQPRTLSYNTAENAVLVTSPVDNGTVELYQLPKDFSGVDMSDQAKKKVGQNAVYVARNKYAVLEKSQQKIVIYNMNNDASKEILCSSIVSASTSGNSSLLIADIFFAGTGLLLLSTSQSMILYDVQQQEFKAELQVTPAKYVYWNHDMSMVAFLSTHGIVIANKKLEQLANIHETMRVKSGQWDSSGIFVYSTLNHIKYALSQGDCGIIKTLDQPMYIVKSHGRSIYCIDRDGKITVVNVDPTEYRFKLALIKRNYDEVIQIIRNSNLVGQSVIAYLREKGYAEVALHFVKDPRTRFDLALECGQLSIAVEMAKSLDQEECWKMLGFVALRQGNVEVVELAYQRLKNFEKLSFLYLILGQRDKLQKMFKIAELRNDLPSKFHNSLYLGLIEEQIKIYKECGQTLLAYCLSKSAGIPFEDEVTVDASVKGNVDSYLSSHFQGLNLPLVPINAVVTKQVSAGGEAPMDAYNWPLLTISRGLFESVLASGSNAATTATAMGGSSIVSPGAPMNPIATAALDINEAEVGGDWGDDDDLLVDESQAAAAGDDDEGAGGWDIDDDLKLEPVLKPAAASKKSASAGVLSSIPPQLGPSFGETWMRNSQLACVHIAAGEFESGMQILNRTVGITDFAPLKQYFMTLIQATRVTLACHPNVPAMLVPVSQLQKPAPKTVFPFSKTIQLLQSSYQATTQGKFAEALTQFLRILHTILFTVVESREELNELNQLISVAREYLIGLKLELARKELPQEAQQRNVELAALFTHCQMQPIHVLLSLRVAMVQAFKLKCFVSAAAFARRLLELGPQPDLAQKARQIIQNAEANPNDSVQLNYNPLNPFVICCGSFTPIYRNTKCIQCSFCQSNYLEKYNGSICTICQVAKVGVTGLEGLRAKN